MVAACLSALAGDRHQDAALTLRALAEERLVDGGHEALPELRLAVKESGAKQAAVDPEPRPFAPSPRRASAPLVKGSQIHPSRVHGPSDPSS